MFRSDSPTPVDPEVEREAAEILAHYGITINEAYNMFLHKVVLEQGIPFELRPTHRDYNAETLEAIEEIQAIERGEFKVKSYASAEEMFEEILGTDA